MWLFSLLFSSLSTLICRGTDISKCLSESLGIRDNESQLYFYEEIRNMSIFTMHFLIDCAIRLCLEFSCCETQLLTVTTLWANLADNKLTIFLSYWSQFA